VDVLPFPSTPGCENCLPPLDRLPADLIERQRFALWPPPSPSRRHLLFKPILWVQKMAAKKDSRS